MLRTPFAGRNQFFDAKQLFPKLTEEKKEKSKAAQKLAKTHHPPTQPLHISKIITNPGPLPMPYNIVLFLGSLLLMKEMLPYEKYATLSMYL